MRGALQLELWRSHPTIAIGNAAVLDVEGVNHPVADETVIILVSWRELRIGTVAQQRAGKVSRDFASNRQVIGVGLKLDRSEFVAQEWVVWKGKAHRRLQIIIFEMDRARLFSLVAPETFPLHRKLGLKIFEIHGRWTPRPVCGPGF